MITVRLWPAAFVLLGILWSSSAVLAQSPTDGLQFEPVAAGVQNPTQVTNAGDGTGRLFAVSQLGTIRVLAGTTFLEEPFLDISDQVFCCSEDGLLGLAFHPDYASNGRFFVRYTDRNANNILAGFRVSEDDPNRADADSEEIILLVPQPSPSHHSGQLHFGPDGMLYVGLGDGGAVQAEAQNLRSLHGSILRIDIDVPSGYAIPPDNPFVSVPLARGEIWVYGLRNPWRFSFDRETGDVFIGEVGHQRAEEIDFIPFSSGGGENYGWNILEGNKCNSENQFICDNPSFSPPIFEIEHVADNCNAIIGGYRYRGSRYPQLYGLYFFGDFCRKRITVLQENAGRWTEIDAFEDVGEVTSFGESESGELFFTDFMTGSVVRFTAPTRAPELRLVSSSALAAGSPAVTLTVDGTTFVPRSEVRWNGMARPTEFVSTSRLRVTLTAEDLESPSTGVIDVVTSGLGGGTSQPRDIEVLDPGDIAPVVAVGGIVDAASFDPSLGVAPGSIASIFGTDLALLLEAAALEPLPTILGAASAVVGPDLEAPLFLGSEGQHNLQIPWELAGMDSAGLRVRIGSVISGSEPIPLVVHSPGIFSTDSTGSGQAAALVAGAGNVLAAPEGAFPNSRPVRPGEFLSLYVNGLGAVSNTPPTGTAASAFPLSVTLTEPVVRLNGQMVSVTFSGLAPGFVGVYQVNVEVPADAQPGSDVTIDIEIGGVRSRALTVAVGVL